VVVAAVVSREANESVPEPFVCSTCVLVPSAEGRVKVVLAVSCAGALKVIAKLPLFGASCSVIAEATAPSVERIVVFGKTAEPPLISITLATPDVNINSSPFRSMVRVPLNVTSSSSSRALSKVIVSVPLAVVIVIPPAAARVRVSPALSATTFDCPDTAMLLNELIVLFIVILSAPALVVIFTPVPETRVTVARVSFATTSDCPDTANVLNAGSSFPGVHVRTYRRPVFCCDRVTVATGIAGTPAVLESSPAVPEAYRIVPMA
jgi:hypothetical protein